MTIPITVLLPCGRVRNYSAFYFLLFLKQTCGQLNQEVFFFFFFFFQFCDVVQSAHHTIHKYTLAKFEYIQNMKVENL
jgi:hypothetical protein